MKMLFLVQFLFGLTAGCAFAQSGPNLADYQWKNRLLLVFFPINDFNLQALFERIDAMPMRQREMRERSQDENPEE